MKMGQYIKTFAEFVTGEINFSEFKQAVEERLWELRQEPEMTEEKKLLSSVELYLHETSEGLRPDFELYAHVQSILDNIILPMLTSEGKNKPVHFPLTVPNIPYLLSKTFDIDPERSDTEEAIRALSTVTPM